MAAPAPVGGPGAGRGGELLAPPQTKPITRKRARISELNWPWTRIAPIPESDEDDEDTDSGPMKTD